MAGGNKNSGGGGGCAARLRGAEGKDKGGGDAANKPNLQRPRGTFYAEFTLKGGRG